MMKTAGIGTLTQGVLLGRNAWQSGLTSPASLNSGKISPSGGGSVKVLETPLIRSRNADFLMMIIVLRPSILRHKRRWGSLSTAIVSSLTAADVNGVGAITCKLGTGTLKLTARELTRWTECPVKGRRHHGATTDSNGNVRGPLIMSVL